MAGRRYSFGRRRGYRRRFRRYFSRFRARTRTIFRTRYRTRYRRVRGSRSSSRSYTFCQWAWKLGIFALLIFGGIYVWNNYLKGKIIKV